MPQIKIWYRYEGKEPEKIDQCSRSDVAYLLQEYALAFGLMKGQHRYKKDKVWAGSRRDEPKERI